MSDNQNSNQTGQPATGQASAPTATAPAPSNEGSQKPKAEKTLEVRLLRGYFPESGVKLKAGEVHELPISIAKKLVNTRKAELPEDEA